MEPQAAQAQAEDASARRLLWRCRRGTKELDVLLERYAAARLPHAPAAERAAFVALLELPDPLLIDFLLNGLIPEHPALAELVQNICSVSAAWQSGPRSGMIGDTPATATPGLPGGDGRGRPSGP